MFESVIPNQFRVFRAMGLGFSSWFRNFIPFTSLAVILYAPVFAWVALSDPRKATSVDDLVSSYFVRPLYVMAGVGVLVPALITYRVVQQLGGQQVSMGESIVRGVRGIAPGLIVAVIVNLLQLIPVGGIIAAVLTCTWFVATPAAVAEKLGPFAAMGRSGVLTLGRRWGIFGLTFLVGLVVALTAMVWIVPAINRGDASFLTSFKTWTVVFMALMGVLHLYTGVVASVSYALLRQDKDGMSHEALAAVFD
ncbi:MAG: hypothetical protein R3B06_16675 [Kofleriaceae bacterium]